MIWGIEFERERIRSGHSRSQYRVSERSHRFAAKLITNWKLNSEQGTGKHALDPLPQCSHTHREQHGSGEVLTRGCLESLRTLRGRSRWPRSIERTEGIEESRDRATALYSYSESKSAGLNAWPWQRARWQEAGGMRRSIETISSTITIQAFEGTNVN